MFIGTKGRPTKVEKKICKEAVEFFGKLLISTRIYNLLHITIKFEEFDRKNLDYAYCEWEYQNHRSKDFIITVNRNLPKKQMLIALAHEMVHVKQYSKGEMKDYIKSFKTKWRDEIYHTDKSDYWEMPWEIEAFGRELGLYYKFIDYMKIRNK